MFKINLFYLFLKFLLNFRAFLRRKNAPVQEADHRLLVGLVQESFEHRAQPLLLQTKKGVVFSGNLFILFLF